MRCDYIKVISAIVPAGAATPPAINVVSDHTMAATSWASVIATSTMIGKNRMVSNNGGGIVNVR